MTIHHLTSQQLRKAAQIKDEIAALEKQLSSILGSGTSAASKPAPTKRRKMSAAGRARIAAGARAWWAKGKKSAKPAKKKGGMSAAGRARIAAAQKLRWAKIKAGKSSPKAGKPVKARRKMSTVARARISALAKARWARVKAAGGKRL
jgi:hypothetical protein